LKKATVLMILLAMAFLIGVSNSFAVEVTLLGPTQYLRTTGAPNQFSDTFPGVVGAGKLIIQNGDESGKHRISSATIKLNGVVVKPNSFSQKVESIEVPVSLLEENILEVSLSSKPGSYITAIVTQNVEAEAAAVIGPEGGVVEVTDPESDWYGVKVDIPEDALLFNTFIILSNSYFSINTNGKLNISVPSSLLRIDPELRFFKKD
jgi:hypothetical protein